MSEFREKDFLKTLYGCFDINLKCRLYKSVLFFKNEF